MAAFGSGNVFSDTLRDITHTKLAELSKRRATFQAASTAAYTALEDTATPTTAGAVSRLRDFIKCVKTAMGLHADGDGSLNLQRNQASALQSELNNLERFLAQAQYDPSVNLEIIKRWTASLVHHLKTEGLRFQYATLYGELVTEWLQAQSGIAGSSGSDISSDVEMVGGAFEDVDNASKVASRMQWEHIVFQPAQVDKAELQRYLAKLYGEDGDINRKGIFEALQKLRRDVVDFESRLASSKFDVAALKSAIQGLLASGHISDEQKQVLGDIDRNPVIQTEISDVLNMRKDALGHWSWGEAVPVQQKRQINGRFNISIQEDLLQAIFLQYLGVEWSIFFKRALRSFRKAEDTWQETRADINSAQKQRLLRFLGNNDHRNCLQKKRLLEYRQNFFLARLLRSRDEHAHDEDGEEEVQLDALQVQAPAPALAPRPQMASRVAPRMYAAAPGAVARKAKRRGAAQISESDVESDDEDYTSDTDEEGDVDQRPKKPMDIKQRILHLLSADIAINLDLYGESTVFHSIFEDWYPHMPHETIKTVLAFLGVSETWLDFFTRFLEAPLRFVDDPTAPIRLRRRGSPASHVLSDVFSELILVNLDFAINQTTNGSMLWRYGDDFWFWSSSHAACITAWETIETFSKVTGTALHRSSSRDANKVAGKSGSVRICRDRQNTLSIDRTLPTGPVCWGFLVLDPSTGRFNINDKLIDEHIVELRKQLTNKRSSVFGFIQAWNTFADRFFNANFGKPCNGFGRSHVDGMLAAHARIQREVFTALEPTDSEGVSCVPMGAEAPDNIIDYLKAIIRARFGVEDVPDGWFYFPQSLGGLNLSSPFVSLLQRRDTVLESPTPLLEAMHAADERAYRRLRAAFLEGSDSSDRKRMRRSENNQAHLRTADDFPSFEDFTQYREHFDLGHDDQVQDVWEKLGIKVIDETSVEQDGRLQAALNALGYGDPNASDISSNWYFMKPYWKWVANMYGPEIVQRFGGLRIVDHGALPMGMVSLFMGKRVTWKD